MFDLKLTEAHEQTMRAQAIDDAHPGTVLRDFATVLDYVGTQGVKAGGKYNLLPITAIEPLDEKLTRPLRLAMKRPQLRSHPYLQGLHLLLRASGLAGVEGGGEKARLVVTPAALEAWRGLNATEQYFTLLEAWLLNSNGQMVGESGRGNGCLFECVAAWQGLSRSPVRFSPQDRLYFPGIGRDHFHLALMELFGLVEIDLPPAPAPRWSPAGVKATAFGDALLTLLASWWGNRGTDEEDEDEDEDEGPSTWAPAGRLQKVVQPYFPEWRANLELEVGEWQDGVYVFRVSLSRDCWRRIAIPADCTLDDLMGGILSSVNFDSDHLYQFTYRDSLGSNVTAGTPGSDDDLAGDEVEIGALSLAPGQSMKLVYDFGDNWKFDVKLERIDPPNKRLKLPKVVEKHGKAPEQYPRWD